MGAVPRPRPPYLLREVRRSGDVVWYVRKGAGPRTRIHGDYGSIEFLSEYQAAVSGKTENTTIAKGSLAWLIGLYRETSTWNDLSRATRRQRENIFKQIIQASGYMTCRITRASVEAGIERRSATPAQARHFLNTLRGLYKWAKKAKHVHNDPTAGIENPQKGRKGPGFRPWTEADVAAYEARWPIGTKERVWLDVLLYTGLRRGDAACLGRQHVRNGIATIKTEKTGTEVILPILPVLQHTLDAGPTGDLTFIVGVRGLPFKAKESFGNAFHDACRAAGVTGSAHGVRKIAATRAAENGATVAQLEAIFGWSGGKMASLYTQAADRRRLALQAASKLERNDDPIPAQARGRAGTSEN